VNVKGTALVSTVRFLKEAHGETAVKRVFSSLPKQERELAEHGFLVSAWYPIDLLMGLTRIAKEQLGGDLAKALGRASADYALTTVYKIFFRVGSPQFIISRAATLYRNYYDEGEMRATVAEKGHAILEVSGFVPPPPIEFCERSLGWFERTLELSGAKEIKLAHDTCMGRGGQVCRFEGWWA
jgi:hypothetical protein